MENRIITVSYGKGEYDINFAVLLGITLSFEGYKVLLVDLNSDGNLSKSLGWKGEGYTINDIISENCSIADVCNLLNKEISYIPAEKESLHTLIENFKSFEDNPLKKFLLMDELDGFEKIIFDCSSSNSNLLTRKANEISDNIIVSPSNVSQYLDTICAVNEELKELRYIAKQKANKGVN